jgi:hypothetical protein
MTSYCGSGTRTTELFGLKQTASDMDLPERAVDVPANQDGRISKEQSSGGGENDQEEICGGGDNDELIEFCDPNLATTLTSLELERQEADRIWALCKTDRHLASPGSKYPRYELAVDQEQGDRAVEIKMLSWKRPHMRALHCAWISFFLAFVIWVAPAPLLREIQLSLGLSKQEVWTSSITNDFTAIITRIAIGPICDAYGARLPMAFVLVFASIPTAMLGLVHSAAGLAVTRFFIGVAGSSFGMFVCLFVW